MTQRPRSPSVNLRFRAGSVMLAHALLFGNLSVGVGVGVGVGCGSRSTIGHLEPDAGSGEAGRPHDPITSSSKLDLLFVIDDSASMAPLQAKFRTRLPEFMNVLKQIPGGLPSLHIAVVSSSLGAGSFENVTGCAPGSIGNLSGAFQHAAVCAGLNGGETFIKSKSGVNNFTGDVTEVLACLTNIGSNGCGFEHPFEATRVALQRATNQSDLENGGFLRPDAFLGIIMLTNEDDCSVPPDSTLLDPNQRSVNDPLGGPTSYRCNEFGHLCNGVAPPHLPPDTPVTLTNCVSAEDGKLVKVAGVAEYLRSLKTEPSRIFVAALAGPPEPYIVESMNYDLGAAGALERLPFMSASCTQSTTGWMDREFADPAVRVAQLVRAFGPNGFFETICADDLGPTMTRIGDAMVGEKP